MFYFSGALDLITTSRDILRQDLRGIISFRHLSSQLEEIQSVIGKMLLGDFKTYISSEINKDIVQAKVNYVKILFHRVRGGASPKSQGTSGSKIQLKYTP